MKIGMVCHPSLGGSGAVAAELGKQLASRGHDVHFISYDLPFRLTDYHDRIFYHAVSLPSYPLFAHPPYILALANRIADVARVHELDVVHVHYAIPHAAAAYLARQVLGSSAFRLITTLHGTDITLIGSDPSFSAMTTFAIEQSDVVTAVSQALADSTARLLKPRKRVQVIHNFIDLEEYSPDKTIRLSHQIDADRRPTVTNFLSSSPSGESVSMPRVHDACSSDGRGGREPIMLHASNFRPLKRVERCIEILRLVLPSLPVRLLLAGDGPELARVLQLAERYGVSDRITQLGRLGDMVPTLSRTDVLLLPSDEESFGLIALEAMACGVPVVASNVGGLPEVVSHGETGFLFHPDDVQGMADAVQDILTHPEKQARLGLAGRHRAEALFSADRIVPMYEKVYRGET